MDSVQSKLLVDGWIFVSEHYEVMGENVMIFSSKGVVISSVNERMFKGVKRLHGREAYSIYLGLAGPTTQQGQPAEYLLLVTGRAGGEQLNQRMIRSVYLESVDAAIDSLDGASKTKKDWKTFNTCHTFSELAGLTSQGDSCLNCSHKLYVQPEDFAQFGMSMNDNMRQKLGPEYKICLLVKRFGQSQPFYRTKNVWSYFRPDLCEEIILHVAEDFWQEGKCMLWKTSAVEGGGYLGNKNVFNTLFLGKHASFEFDRMKSYGPGIQLPGPGVMFYANLKFYIDPFKEIHRGKGEPWKRPEVERTFTTTPLYGGKATPIGTLKAWLDSLKSSRKLIEEQGFNHARFEAIINMSGATLGFDVEEDINAQTILRKFKRFFRENFCDPGEGIQSHLASFDFKDFLQQIDETLMRAVYTLEGLVMKVATMREDRNKSIDAQLPSIRDVILGVACEVLISLGVYGCINYYYGAKSARHDRRWREVLNLKPATLASQRVFGGLRRISCVEARGEVGEGQFGRIVYNGPIFLKNHVSNTLYKAGLADDNIKELVQLIREVYESITVERRTNDQMVPAYRQIATHLWNEFARQIFKISEDPRGIDRDPADFIRLAQNFVREGKKLIFQNTYEFLRRLFRTLEYKSNFALGYCVRELREILTDAGFIRDFLELVAEYFDVQLYKSRGLAIVISWGMDKRSGDHYISYVLPCVGTVEDCYEFTSQQAYHQDLVLKQRLVQQQWEYAYQRTYQRNIGDQQTVSVILLEAAIAPNVRNSNMRVDALLELMHVRNLMSSAL